MYELEGYRQFFNADLIPNNEKAEGLINLAIKHFNYRLGKVLLNKKNKLDAEKEIKQLVNFNLVLKELARRDKKELKLTYKSLKNLSSKGFIKIVKAKDRHFIIDYILTAKALNVAQKFLK